MVNGVKLAVSHIAWQEEDEREALAMLQKHGFEGLEIAPPRVAGPLPYEKPQTVAEYARNVQSQYGLKVCSMQSIWYGKSACLFLKEEREELLAYSKQAIRFAEAAAIPNLVFGCPKNRVVPPGGKEDDAVSFFKELGEMAKTCGTCFSLEANPPIYGTNFMNTTEQALNMAKRVNSAGCKVNLDVGTMIENREPTQILRDRMREINHIHISEPGLKPIQPRKIHSELAALLKEEGYRGYVSVEMKSVSLSALQECLSYIKEAFS